MNKVYRSIWNAATRTWMAAPETAKRNGKGTRSASAVALVAVGATLFAGMQNGHAQSLSLCTPLLGASVGTSGGVGVITGANCNASGVSFALTNGTPLTASATIGITGYTDGRLELKGAGGISLLNAVRLNNNRISQLANGTLSASSTEAITGQQLFSVGAGVANALGGDATLNADATLKLPTYTVGGAKVTGVEGAVKALDTRLSDLGDLDMYIKLASPNAKAAAASGNDAIAVGAGAVAQGPQTLAIGTSATASKPHANAMGTGAQATAEASVALGYQSVADREHTVSVGSDAMKRQIVNVAAGALDNDATNVAQLKSVVAALGGGAAIDTNTGAVTGPTYTLQNGGPQHTVGAALGALDGALKTARDTIQQHSTSIDTINTKLHDLGSGAPGLVLQPVSGADLTVGANTNGAVVNFRGTGNVTRKLTGLTSGDVVAGGADAVTGGQLFATEQVVDQQGKTIGSLGDAVGGHTTKISALTQTVSDHTTDIDTLNTKLSNLGSGAAGLVQQAGASADLTIGASTGGAVVSFVGTGGATRKLTGLTSGDVVADSTDAVTGSQLFATEQTVDRYAKQLGALGETVGDHTTKIGTLTQTVSDHSTDIESINTKLGNLGSGATGLVLQADAGADLTVGASTGGAAVNFSGTGNVTRKLTGLTQGEIAVDSTDAVTGGQLFATEQSVDLYAKQLGTLGDTVGDHTTKIGTLTQTVSDHSTDIESINTKLGNLGSGATGLVLQADEGADLTVGAGTSGAAVNFSGTGNATRKLTGLTQGDVGVDSTDAITGSQLFAAQQTVNQHTGQISTLSQTVKDHTGDIESINTTLSKVSVGATLLQQDSATGAISMGADVGGTSVNLAGTGGTLRTLTGVANGVKDSDAATVAQLRAVGLVDASGLPVAAVTYADMDMKSISFGGGADGTLLRNVAAGSIAAGSKDAVNGGQLYSLQQEIQTNLGAMDTRVSSLEVGGTKPADPESPPGSGIGPGTGAGSLATEGAVASGSRSVAMGRDASATHDNAVALGAGSVTDRDKSVSIGAAGDERQLTNLAAGTAATDAVNVQQMNNTVRSARQDAMGGVAAAMAVAGLPQSTLPGRTFMAVSGSTYGSEYGTAIGVSYMAANGKWVVKAAGNTSSRGEVGAVVGGGFYW